MAIKRDKILKNAEKLVQKGKLEQAIREYEKLLKASPDDTNTINRLGDLYGRVGEIDKAVSLYEKVAEGFAGQGFVPKAIAIYKKINRLAPQRLDIFERLGELYIEQGLMVEAKGQFRMLAEHYARNEDTESAIRAHQRLGEIDPDDSTTRLKFADLLLESGDVEKAMEAYGALGETLMERDQLDEAERLYRRLLDLEFPNGDVMAPVCARLLDVGRTTSAQELLAAGLEVSPESIPLRTLQVRTFMSLGDSDAAVELAQEILEVDPDNPDVRGLVGNVMISDGEQEEAAEMMIPAAEALLEKADYSKAQRMLRELVEISPTDERILRLAIRAFRPSGDQEMLIRLTASLADVCFTNGQEDQAKRFYLELVASDPTNELYRERLAHLDGAAAEAVDGTETAGFGDEMPSEITFSIDDEEDVEAAPDAPATQGAETFDPAEQINEAAVFAKYGLNEKAVKHLEEVVNRVPDHNEARESLARMYLAVGRRDDAVRTVEPVIREHRASGNQTEAEQLERLFGEMGEADDEDLVVDDDEVIIVEIDGDEISETAVVEISETAVDEVILDAVDLTDVSVDEIVANAVGDLEITIGQPEPVVIEPAAETLDEEPQAPDTADEPHIDVVLETAAEEIVDEEPVAPKPMEEELVEISTGVDGPSINELAQLDLFVEQELFEDAVGILARLEADYPDHPDLAQRRQQLEELGAMDEQVEEPEPVEESERVEPVEAAEPEVVAEVEAKPEPAEVKKPAPRPVAQVEPVQSPDDIFDDEEPEEYIDLAKELEEELAEEEAMVEEATGRGKGEALLDEVFKEFQKGVAEQLSDEDSDTHFNLGIAYKEMGLLEEAIGEFKVASHDPAFFVEACSMIGVCANELEKHEEAAEWYQKALVAPDLSPEARTALRYELASALEKTGNVEQATDLFQEIQNHDPAYRDVGDRITALAEQRQVN
jgi:tetratricopeptide (TPR) repeat protein